MTGWTNDEYEVECPMPDCTNQLDLLFNGLVTLSPEDLTEGRAASVANLDALSWQVECRAGHVILLPTEDSHCGCDDLRKSAVDHEHWSDPEESRKFRASDMVRLRSIITAIDGAR